MSVWERIKSMFVAREQRDAVGDGEKKVIVDLEHQREAIEEARESLRRSRNNTRRALDAADEVLRILDRARRAHGNGQR
jgi:hypothetical protein